MTRRLKFSDNEWVIIKKSKVEGLGVFAKKDILKALHEE